MNDHNVILQIVRNLPDVVERDGHLGRVSNPDVFGRAWMRHVILHHGPTLSFEKVCRMSELRQLPRTGLYIGFFLVCFCAYIPGQSLSRSVG